MAKYKSDDVELLLPSFRAVYKRLLERMKELGYDPIPFDTLRTAEEAARNVRRGVGIADSIHLYGAAADTICGKHGWSCAEYKHDFYRALRREGLALGLYHADGKKIDPPHLQGVPATKKAQDALRALGRGPESLASRDAVVRSWLKVA
jgi:hypothetical protein